MINKNTPAQTTEWLLGSVNRKKAGLSDKLKYNPYLFLHQSKSVHGALCRQIHSYSPLPTDIDVLDELAGVLMDHILEHREPSNDAFQKGYAELILKQHPQLQNETVALINKQWESKQKIGHYELFSALILQYPDEAVIKRTLLEIHNLLRTWGNEGWCPWTPALWMRMLWLGENQIDASDDITRQLEYIDAHLSEGGKFQYREPFCLMYSIGLMDSPLRDKMLDRFLRVVIAEQQPDGGWGDYSYIAFTLLKKWDLLEVLAP